MANLQQEIRQNKPFKSRKEEALLNIERTASLLLDDFELRIKEYGLSSAQYNVLRILRGAGPDGLCRNDLRSRLLRRMPDVTRLLDRMESSGLVTRARDSEDRRLVSTRLTEKGRRLVDKLDPIVAQEHQRRLGHMTDAQLKALVDLLTLVRERA